MMGWDTPDALSEYDPTHAALRDLMGYRVREVLLVSSLYDSYILEEDGQLSESLDAEFYQLNLSTSPRITQVPTAQKALATLKKRPFDLVITMPRLDGMDARVFARAVRELHPDLPVVMLADNHFEAHRIKELNRPPALDQVFVWRGDEALGRRVRRIEDVVEASRERVDVLAVEGRDERGVQLGERLGRDAVTLVLEFLQPLDLGWEVGGVIQEVAEELDSLDDVGLRRVEEIEEINLLGQEPAHATPGCAGVAQADYGPTAGPGSGDGSVVLPTPVVLTGVPVSIISSKHRGSQCGGSL
jgi:CheY-like chemotaxis protein